MILQIIPYMLIRIQLRCIEREEENSQDAVGAFYILAYIAGAMYRAVNPRSETQVSLCWQ
jgi:hypothetical protein